MDIIDPVAKEVTLDTNGVSSNSYRPRLDMAQPQVLTLYNNLVSEFPDVLAPPFPPISNWELIDYTKANGQNYLEDAISVLYTGRPTAELLERLQIDLEWLTLSQLGETYTLKFFLDSKRIVLKIEDMDFDRHRPPSLPVNARLAVEFGVGVHVNAPELERLRDVYFYHDGDPSEVAKHFKVDIPSVDGSSQTVRLYGCLYDILSDKVIKIKEYRYPGNPGLVNV